MRRPRKKPVTRVIWHATASPPDRDMGVADIDKLHRNMGWDGCGYHIVIKRNGKIEFGEHLNNRGAHTYGYNETSIGVALSGGVDDTGKAVCNYTEDQIDSARCVFEFLSHVYPVADHVGHRSLSPDVDGDGEVSRDEWLKDCPCFDVHEFFYGSGSMVFYVEDKRKKTKKHDVDEFSNG